MHGIKYSFEGCAGKHNSLEVKMTDRNHKIMITAQNAQHAGPKALTDSEIARMARSVEYLGRTRQEAVATLNAQYKAEATGMALQT